MADAQQARIRWRMFSRSAHNKHQRHTESAQTIDAGKVAARGWQ